MKRSKQRLRRKSRLNRIPTTVPTEKDWGSYQSDLDCNHAHKLFAVRNNEEMRRYFHLINPIGMMEDLRWMPEIPFQYYMLGFRDFVMAGDFREAGNLRDCASTSASCFLGLVLAMLENRPRHIVPIIPELLPAIEYVAHHQAAFDANESIYGSFLEKLERIQALYAANSNS